MSRFQRVFWYARRLQIISRRELVHRVVEVAWLLSFHLRYTLAIAVPRPVHYNPHCFGFCSASAPQLASLPWDESALDRTGTPVLDCVWPALGFPWSWRPGGEAWHIAPDTGRTWPRRFFARIAHRPGNRTGDVRVTWEPARLQHLVTLALLSQRADGGREQVAALVEQVVVDWATANPFLEGVHHVSAMECGLRILALCHALDLTRGHFSGGAVWKALLAIVDGHAQLIERRLSLHSSAGNHTIAEAAGLLYAGCLFPELRGAKRWFKRGLEVLEREAERQVLPDGGGIEQAVWYHLFVIELLGLVTMLLRARAPGVPQIIETAFVRGSTFLRALGADTAELPRVGDSDDGRALSVYLRLVWETGSPPNNQTLRVFPASGYVLMQPAGSVHERALFDCGSLGMAPACGHGHADALAITYERNGVPVLVDPGTFMYGSDPECRRYFRSTAAHNTVTVDGRDQARQGGAFLWSEHYTAELVHQEVRADGVLLALARHDGYSSLGVMHWRGLAHDPGGFWLIYDYLVGKGEHKLALHWHTGATVTPLDGGGFLFDHAGTSLFLSLQGGDVTLHRGERMPFLGWISPGYGRLDAAVAVTVGYSGPLPHSLVTLISKSPRTETLFRLDALLNYFTDRIGGSSDGARRSAREWPPTWRKRLSFPFPR